MISSEKSLILIVDRNNLFGQQLGEKLSQSATVVLVSNEHKDGDSSVMHVPYYERFPQIPDGMYRKIIFVWTKEDEHLFDPLYKKAKDQSLAFFIIAEKENQEKIKKEIRQTGTEITLLIVGDLFGLHKKSLLGDFLNKIKETKKVTLANMGLHLWYPILFDDTEEKIFETLSIEEKTKRVLFIGPEHGLTALSLVHAIQKIDPEILVDFSKEEEINDTFEKGKSAFHEYDSIDKIQQYYHHLVIKNKKNQAKERVGVVFKSNGKKKMKSHWFLYVVYFLFIFLVFPIVLAIISGGMGAILLGAGVMDVKKADFDQSLLKIRASEQEFAFSNAAFDITEKEFSIIGQAKSIAFLHGEVMLGYGISQAAGDGVDATKKLSNVLLGKTLSPKNDIGDAIGELKHTSFLLQQIPSAMISVQYKDQFNALNKMTTMLSDVVDELPQILGVTGDRSYLVLFQNNMELRPGGGFIGSYGLIKLHLGAIKEFSIHDVYDADGQLKGHVEPPFAIRRYIPLVHLYLRDSNFDPDFTKNAQTAAFLLSQETGDRVDGVFAIDLDVLKSALMNTGAIYVSSYDETVTDKNFFLLIEKHAEKNSFPGSTQKKEFLMSFFGALQDTIQKKPLIDFQNIANQIVALLEGKHILFDFADPSLQIPFTYGNLSDSLVDTRASTSGRINDFLGINEANLGINKVNAFVSRKLTQHIIIDEKGTISESVSLSLTNDSDSNWPGGVYRNFIRFLLPNDAVLTNVIFDGVEQQTISAVTDPLVYESKNFTPPVGLEVTKDTEAGKTVYGFLVTIPEKSSKEITIQYKLGNTFSINQLQNIYSVVVWRQPGVSEFPYDLTIDIPSTLTVLKTNLPTMKNSNSIYFQTSITKDTTLDISLVSK